MRVDFYPHGSFYTIGIEKKNIICIPICILLQQDAIKRKITPRFVFVSKRPLVQTHFFTIDLNNSNERRCLPPPVLISIIHSSSLTANDVQGSLRHKREDINRFSGVGVRVQPLGHNGALLGKHIAEAIQNVEVERRRYELAVLKPALTCCLFGVASTMGR